MAVNRREWRVLNPKYEFEPMHDETYQVRLQGEFVCYTNKKSEQVIDAYLKRQGFESRTHYLDACREEREENV